MHVDQYLVSVPSGLKESANVARVSKYKSLRSISSIKVIQYIPFIPSLITRNIIVDGGWSSWSAYRKCSVTCGRGTKTRRRKCNSPKSSNGGKPCAGRDSQSMVCEGAKCPGIFSLSLDLEISLE